MSGLDFLFLTFVALLVFISYLIWLGFKYSIVTKEETIKKLELEITKFKRVKEDENGKKIKF